MTAPVIASPQGQGVRGTMLSVAHVEIIFSAEQAAAALWTYGEDDLVDPASKLTIDQLRTVWRSADARWKPDHGLPLKSRLVLDKATALACIEYLEGALRPLHQERRRSRSSMPDWLAHAEPVPPGTISGARD